MLTQEQITSYSKNGFLAVENVLSEQEVADLRRVTDEFVAQVQPSLRTQMSLIWSQDIQRKRPACAV